MSSIATVVPSGTIEEWCIKSLYDFSDDVNTCANSSRGTVESDFQTICCDGWIIDSSFDLYEYKPNRTDPVYVDLNDLVCCRVQGAQQGGIQPIVQGNGLTCTTGTPTPLASMAATNISNAQNYLATYTSASFGASNEVGGFIPTATPYCLWADTAHGVAMQSVTVPEAEITTLPPATTDFWGDPLTTSSSTSSPAVTSFDPSAAGSSAASASTVSSAEKTGIHRLVWLALAGTSVLSLMGN